MSTTLLSIFGLVGIYWLITLVADALYREKLPEKLPFSLGLGRGALSRVETVRNLGFGLVFACFGLAYVTLFYVISARFGAWSPVEIDYSKVLSGHMPWLSGLEIGLNAAWLEEILFRVIAILLYWKLFRNRWVAIILAAVTWGFLHSNYPQMPGYLRGVELTLEGTLWGVLLLRHGLVTTLTAHYLYNCWLSSFVVWPSPQWDHKLGVLAVAVWPVALWLYGCWKIRQPDTVVEPTPTFAVPSAPVSAYVYGGSAWNFALTPLTAIQRRVLLVVGLLLYAGSQTISLPQDVFRRFGRIELTRPQIQERAAALLRARGYDPATYRSLPSVSNNGTNTTYLLESNTLAAVADFFGAEWPDLQWSVRYFRCGEKEEFRLQFDKNGRLIRWSHLIPREAPGASLEKEAALQLATDYLVHHHGFDPAREKLVSDDVTQQEKRRDYTFVFERRDWKWGEAKLRTAIEVQGDEVMDYSHFVKVPEKWQRDRAKSGWKEALLGESATWLSFVKIVIFIVLLVLMIRQHILPWRISFQIALVPTALSVIVWLNQWPSFWAGYGTTQQASVFIFEKFAEFLQGILFAYLGQVFLLTVTLGLMRWAFGWTVEHFPRVPAEPEERRRFFTDLFVLLVFSLGFFKMQNVVLMLVNGLYFPDRVAGFSLPDINNALPFVDALCGALQSGYKQTLEIAFKFALAVLIYRKFPRLVWIFCFTLPLWQAAYYDTSREFLHAFLTGELSWLLLLLLVWRFWRFHPLLIFTIYLTSSLFASSRLFLLKGGPYAWNALPLILVAAIPLALAWPSFKKALLSKNLHS